jgi:hypothetical protein
MECRGLPAAAKKDFLHTFQREHDSDDMLFPHFQPLDIFIVLSHLIFEYVLSQPWELTQQGKR